MYPKPGFWNCCGEMGLRQVELGFSSFFAIVLGIFDNFSKWSAPKVLQSFVQLALNPFLHSMRNSVKTRNPGFGYPIRHYIATYTTIYISYSPFGKVANHRKIKNPWPKTYPIVKNCSRFAKGIWTDGSTRRHCHCFQTTRRSSREGERSDGKSFESIITFLLFKKRKSIWCFYVQYVTPIFYLLLSTM